MFTSIYIGLIRAYRAIPFRAHCDAGQHVRLCRWLRLPDASTGTGYGYAGTQAIQRAAGKRW